MTTRISRARAVSRLRRTPGARAADQIARKYREETGLNPQILVPL
jgi:hypothetical protein